MGKLLKHTSLLVLGILLIFLATSLPGATATSSSDSDHVDKSAEAGVPSEEVPVEIVIVPGEEATETGPVSHRAKAKKQEQQQHQETGTEANHAATQKKTEPESVPVTVEKKPTKESAEKEVPKSTVKEDQEKEEEAKKKAEEERRARDRHAAQNEATFFKNKPDRKKSTQPKVEYKAEGNGAQNAGEDDKLQKLIQDSFKKTPNSKESTTDSHVHHEKAATAAAAAAAFRSSNYVMTTVYERDIYSISKPAVILGSEGSEDDQFMQPWRTAVLPTGEIAVVDSGNNRISVWSPDGVFLRHIGAEELLRPRDLFVHQNGTIFVVDRFNNRIVRFSVDGEELGSFRSEEPLSFTFSPSWDQIYIAESHWNQVHLYGDDGKFLKKLLVADENNEFAQLKSVQALDFNKDGNLILADSSNHRMLIVTSTGKFVKQLGTKGTYSSKKGEFNVPYDTAIAPDGKVFICDFGNHRIQVFSPEYEYLHSFGSDGKNPGEFLYPVSVTVTNDYRIIVADIGNNRVQIF